MRAQLITKIMEQPELAAAFQKPKVMQAIMEAQQNPMAIMKYQDDPDVKMVRPALNANSNPKSIALRGDFVCPDRSCCCFPCGAQAPPLNPCMCVFQQAKSEQTAI